MANTRTSPCRANSGIASRTPARGRLSCSANIGTASSSCPKRARSRSPPRSLGSRSTLNETTSSASDPAAVSRIATTGSDEGGVAGGAIAGVSAGVSRWLSRVGEGVSATLSGPVATISAPGVPLSGESATRTSVVSGPVLSSAFFALSAARASAAGTAGTGASNPGRIADRRVRRTNFNRFSVRRTVLSSTLSRLAISQLDHPSWNHRRTSPSWALSRFRLRPVGLLGMRPSMPYF